MPFWALPSSVYQRGVVPVAILASSGLRDARLVQPVGGTDAACDDGLYSLVANWVLSYEFSVNFNLTLL